VNRQHLKVKSLLETVVTIDIYCICYNIKLTLTIEKKPESINSSQFINILFTNISFLSEHWFVFAVLYKLYQL